MVCPYNLLMPAPTNNIKIILVLLAFLAFFLILIPNSRGSDNLAMIAVFEPDEAVQLPVVIKMLTPKDDALLTIKKFVAYEYYFYGFPFFGSSALALLPIKLIGAIEATPLVLLVLRQFVSVLPTLAALLLLVYMHDQFSTWKSIAIFLFLIFVPGVVSNGFWWHPDGLVLLLAVLVIYFLWRDDNQFGQNYYLAAVTAGVLTATKIIGVFFFLAVFVCLIWGVRSKRLTIKGGIQHGILFITVMTISFVMANPFLLSEWGRVDYFSKIRGQSTVLSQGYGIVYPKGFSTIIKQLQLSYGHLVTITLAVLGNVYGIIKSKSRRLYLLILAWCLPITIYLLTSVHYKFQYWLPVIVPLFSGLYVLLPQKHLIAGKLWGFRWVNYLTCVVLFVQTFVFGVAAVKAFEIRANRAESNPLITSFIKIEKQLSPIEKNDLLIYHDVRLYMPPKAGWRYESTTDLLSYNWIQSRNFDVLLLMQQRLYDYLQPDVIGVYEEEFATNQLFYKNAQAGSIEGYQLIDRDQTVLIFLSDKICDSQPGLCP